MFFRLLRWLLGRSKQPLSTLPQAEEKPVIIPVNSNPETSVLTWDQRKAVYDLVKEEFCKGIRGFYDRTTPGQRGVYSEIRVWLVLTNALGKDPRLANVVSAMCTTPYSVEDKRGADIILVIRNGPWIPLQIKRRKYDVETFQDDFPNTPIVQFNDRDNDKEILDKVLSSIKPLLDLCGTCVGK